MISRRKNILTTKNDLLIENDNYLVIANGKDEKIFECPCLLLLKFKSN